MVEYYKDKNNYLMFDKSIIKKHLLLLVKPASLIQCLGEAQRSHQAYFRWKNKYPLDVGIYDLEGNLISKLKNNVELAKYLNINYN